MAYTPFLCIGGPLHNKTATYPEVHGLDYTPYNCAHGGCRSKFAQRRAAARGEVIAPSMVFIHRSCFEGGGLPLAGVNDAS